MHGKHVEMPRARRCARTIGKVSGSVVRCKDAHLSPTNGENIDPPSPASERGRGDAMTTTTLYVLGAPDPEMAAIEGLLGALGAPYIHATNNGRRVHPGNAYAAEAGLLPEGGNVFCVEVDIPTPPAGTLLRYADHHRPGDAGYGRQPADAVPASSIGQVLAHLAREHQHEPSALISAVQATKLAEHLQNGPAGVAGEWHWWPWARRWALCVTSWDYGNNAQGWLLATKELIHVAAADHCLGAAYQGQVPGCEPIDLMHYRVRTRAAHQGIDPDQLADQILEAGDRLDDAHSVHLGGGVWVKDMRGPIVPELPEAATRAGAGYIAGPIPDRDGRQKYTCSGTAEQVRAFMEHFADRNSLLDIYGDPARGFAGAYAAQREEG